MSYDHIEKDVVRFSKKRADQVHTILLDMDNLWLDHVKAEPDSLTLAQLPESFLLYPASSWKHKNHLKLFQAMLQLRMEDINLVLTGRKSNYNKSLGGFLKVNGLLGRVTHL